MRVHSLSAAGLVLGRITRPLVLAVVAMALALATLAGCDDAVAPTAEKTSEATALAQEIPLPSPESMEYTVEPPAPEGEPPKPVGEPTASLPQYEVLLISGNNNVTYQASPGLPAKITPASAVVGTAEKYAKLWKRALYRPTIIYAPPTAARIQVALEGIAKKYEGKEAALAGIAIHYWPHGDDGVILIGKESGLGTPSSNPDSMGVINPFEIRHDAVGKAVANAFPSHRFKTLNVLAVFDACKQEGALEGFPDGVLAGRQQGTTIGHTISSTRGWLPGTCYAEVGVYSQAFPDNLFGPGADAVRQAHNAAVQKQKAVSTWFVRGEGIMKSFAKFGLVFPGPR